MKPSTLLSKPVLLLFAVVSTSYLFAQTKPVSKLDPITPKDFVVNSPVVDENSNAVVLASIGSSDFEGNDKGNITLIFTITKRILLRNRKAFDDATIKVPIYMGESYDDEESFEKFEATTYNLENGVVTETKLDKASLFKEKYNEYYNIRKFTFPNLKEGSIIEYKYTIKSPFWSRLREWDFQGKYPVLWSQYKVTIPPMFDYYSQRKGYLKYTIDSARKEYKTYSIIFPDGGVNFYSGDAVIAIWAIKDVPAFKKEPFTSTTDNYITKINFHLRAVRYSEEVTKVFMKTWQEKVAEVLKKPFFSDLADGNHWLNDELKKVIDTTTTEENIVKKIYSYVRDNYATANNETITPSQSLRKTFQTKTGNVADINLLLVAMLRNIGFSADPVILSKRDNGFVFEAAPFFDEYNYLIARTTINNNPILLDASQSMLGFGKVSEDCLNGTGRVFNSKLPILVPLSADSVKESKLTSVFVYNDSAKGIIGNYTSTLGYYESLELRKELSGKSKESYINSIKKSYPSEIEISNVNIDSIKKYDDPISIQYDMKLSLGDDQTIYVNPLFNESIKTNPFASAERTYPVEMPYKEDESYTFNMEIPKGYKVDELPHPARVKLNEDEGMFEYLIASDGETVQMRCRLQLKKANFDPSDYATLRDFYALVVKKEAEQIVFKKIK